VPQYLTFQLAGEEYGVDILKVQEIRAIGPITPMPNTPPHVKGVMNLRGVIIPVLDLRSRFGMPAEAYGRFTVIIVVTVGVQVVGLVVDSVSDVLTIARESIEPAPGVAGSEAGACVAGLAHHGDRLVIMLDLTAILGSPEPAAVARMA
jgi:purine-binding chemotaxis protein CheW